jgi:uracil-DNA glycosylase
VNPDQRRAVLDAIAAEVSACTRCPLHVGRTLAVPGEGNPETEVVFVGEGPGFNEDQQGRPFVGAAGTLLNELIRAIAWRRDEVFITNVVKCRPPGNRDPEPAEIAACAPYLRRQLEVLDPALVITLGRHSLQTFMPGARIGQAHGTTHPVDPASGARDATVVAMYHPAAALRQHSLRETMLEDMSGVPRALIDSRARRDRGEQPAPAPAPPHAEEPPRPTTHPVAIPITAPATTAPATTAPTSTAAPHSAEAALPGPAPIEAADEIERLDPAPVGAAERVPDNQMELF